MKITITAVSVPALRQIQAFRKRYEQQYPEDDLTIVCFYVAGQEQRYVLEPERIIQDIATADVAVVDTMGASEELQEIVAKGLKAYSTQIPHIAENKVPASKNDGSQGLFLWIFAAKSRPKTLAFTLSCQYNKSCSF